MNRRASKLVFLFTFAIAGSATLAPRDADAYFRRYQSYICLEQTDYIGDYLPNTDNVMVGVSNDTGSRARTVHCPIVDADNINHDQLTGLYLDFYDATSSGPVSAYACSHAPLWDDLECGASRYSCSTGGGCSTNSEASFTGYNNLSIDRTGLLDGTNPTEDRADYYGFINVSIPAKSGSSGRSVILGYLLQS